MNQLQAGGGSGLGLWISKGIVELHGGHITGKSDSIGHGSTFTVMIPVYASQKTLENPYIAIPVIDESIVTADTNLSDLSGLITPSGDNVMSMKQAKKDSLAHKRILIVDDSAISRKMVARILISQGYEICQANDGLECLERVKASYDLEGVTVTGFDYFDLILMDSEMPNMNGPDATYELRLLCFTSKFTISSLIHTIISLF